MCAGLNLLLERRFGLLSSHFNRMCGGELCVHKYTRFDSERVLSIEIRRKSGRRGLPVAVYDRHGLSRVVSFELTQGRQGQQPACREAVLRIEYVVGAPRAVPSRVDWGGLRVHWLRPRRVALVHAAQVEGMHVASVRAADMLQSRAAV